jgi:hypothetical protein
MQGKDRSEEYQKSNEIEEASLRLVDCGPVPISPSQTVNISDHSTSSVNDSEYTTQPRRVGVHPASQLTSIRSFSDRDVGYSVSNVSRSDSRSCMIAAAAFGLSDGISSSKSSAS